MRNKKSRRFIRRIVRLQARKSTPRNRPVEPMAQILFARFETGTLAGRVAMDAAVQSRLTLCRRETSVPGSSCLLTLTSLGGSRYQSPEGCRIRLFLCAVKLSVLGKREYNKGFPLVVCATREPCRGE